MIENRDYGMIPKSLFMVKTVLQNLHVPSVLPTPTLLHWAANNKEVFWGYVMKYLKQASSSGVSLVSILCVLVHRKYSKQIFFFVHFLILGQ